MTDRTIWAGMSVSDKQSLLLRLQQSMGMRSTSFEGQSISWSDETERRKLIRDLYASIEYDQTGTKPRRTATIVGRRKF